MQRPLLDYDIFCTDASKQIDIHQVLAYRVNPKLAEMARKYCKFRRREWARVIEEWINEYDGAKIMLLYTVDDRDFNEYVVDWLYSLRDFLADHKLDLNSFRYYVADTAVVAAQRSPDLYKDICEVLEMLGCHIQLKTERDYLRDSEVHDVLNTLKNVALAYGTRPSDVVRISIRVLRGGKPAKDVVVRATTITRCGTEPCEHSVTLRTDDDGVATVIAPKFSILKIKAEGITKDVVVTNKDDVVNLTLKSRRSWAVAAAIAAAIAAATALLWVIGR